MSAGEQKPLLEKNSDVLALWEGTDPEGSDSSLKGKGARKGKGQRSAGQLVQLRFKAPKPGKYSLQLYVMSGGLAQQRGAVPATLCQEAVLRLLCYLECCCWCFGVTRTCKVLSCNPFG